MVLKIFIMFIYLFVLKILGRQFKFQKKIIQKLVKKNFLQNIIKLLNSNLYKKNLIKKIFSLKEDIINQKRHESLLIYYEI